MGLVLVAPAVALVALLVIYPVGLVLKSAFVVRGHWTLTEFRVVFTQVPYPTLFNTLSLAAEVTVGALYWPFRWPCWPRSGEGGRWSLRP